VHRDLSFKEGAAQALLLMAVSIGSTMLAVTSWRRYHRTMAVAEHLGARSCCPKCDAYGRFEVIASGGRLAPNADDNALGWLRVRCKRCQHEWLVD
jgi:hypothetical protein